MSSQDLLNYVLVVGVIILVASFAYVSFRVAQTLGTINSVIEKGTSYNLGTIKDKIKFSFLNTVSSMLNTFLKGVR